MSRSQCPRCNYKGAELFCEECNYTEQNEINQGELIPIEVLRYLHELPSEYDYPADSYSFEIEEPDGPLDFTSLAAGGFR